jgi:hypothetical protein
LVWHKERVKEGEYGESIIYSLKKWDMTLVETVLRMGGGRIYYNYFVNVTVYPG